MCDIDEHGLSPQNKRLNNLISQIGNLVDVDCKPFGSLRMIVVNVDKYGHLMLKPCREKYQPNAQTYYADWMAN